MMDRRGRGRADFLMDWQVDGWMDGRWRDGRLQMAACLWDFVYYAVSCEVNKNFVKGRGRERLK